MYTQSIDKLCLQSGNCRAAVYVVVCCVTAELSHVYGIPYTRADECLWCQALPFPTCCCCYAKSVTYMYMIMVTCTTAQSAPQCRSKCDDKID